jgi:riboflavin kinase
MPLWSTRVESRLLALSFPNHHPGMVVLSGIVVGGQGDFADWIEKSQEHYTRKTGMILFPGTLNILLNYPYSLPPDAIRLEKEEYGGKVSLSLVPCRIFDRRAFLLRTDANEAGRGHHPRTISEIATDVNLREHYKLKDGDRVAVEVEHGLG